MGKTLDLTKSVYELCSEYPEVKYIMKEIGFEHIVNPAMLNTAGRLMTIPKGARMKDISLDHIIAEFAKRGFEVINNTQEGEMNIE